MMVDTAVRTAGPRTDREGTAGAKRAAVRALTSGREICNAAGLAAAAIVLRGRRAVLN